MKFIIDNWMLIRWRSASGGMLLWPVVQGATGRRPVAPQAPCSSSTASGRWWSDVSEAEEFAAGHVGGAQECAARPARAAPARGGEEQDAAADPGLRQRRARQPCAGTAKKLGLRKAQVLAGGLKAWKDANLPVEKA